MKTGRIALSVLALISSLCVARLVAEERTVHDSGSPEYIVYTLPITASSTAVTNTHVYDWRVGNIIVNIPGGDMTNTITYKHVRVVTTNQYLGNVVSTNRFGEVETNYFGTVTNTITTKITNTMLSVTTTNLNSHQYQEIEDWPAYDYIIPRDELQFTFSPATNSFYLIINGIR